MQTALLSNANHLLAQLPGPEGQRFATAFAHGTMSVELYAPVGADNQTPHQQDELYIVRSGQATLLVEGEPHPCAAGTVVFVPALADHRFVEFSADFTTWVIFWGPHGGEVEAA
jgi:mannose-6-phosphate isomerase-like protein (cupin superfamily)